MKPQQLQEIIKIALWENVEGISNYKEAHEYWNYLNTAAPASEKAWAWEKAGLEAIFNLA